MTMTDSHGNWPHLRANHDNMVMTAVTMVVMTGTIEGCYNTVDDQNDDGHDESGRTMVTTAMWSPGPIILSARALEGAWNCRTSEMQELWVNGMMGYGHGETGR